MHFLCAWCVVMRTIRCAMWVVAVSRRLWWGAYGPESIFEFLVPRPLPESLGGPVPIRATRIAHKPALSGELVPVKTGTRSGTVPG